MQKGSQPNQTASPAVTTMDCFFWEKGRYEMGVGPAFVSADAGFHGRAAWVGIICFFPAKQDFTTAFGRISEEQGGLPASNGGEAICLEHSMSSGLRMLG